MLLLTFPDEIGGEPYFHDQIVYCDYTPDSKVQMNVWRRELGIRVTVLLVIFQMLRLLACVLVTLALLALVS